MTPLCSYIPYSTKLSFAIVLSIVAGFIAMTIWREIVRYRTNRKEKREIAEMHREHDEKVKWLLDRIKQFKAA